MANPIVIVHGWSDNHASFRTLRDFLADNLGVAVTTLRLGDWISLDDDIGYADIAMALQRAWQDANLPTSPRSVDVVAHSTGALVVREWMTRYHTPDSVPIQRFLQLAPANFGSHLAHKGRSFIGRAIKGWRSGFETGTRILRGLELASPYTRELADKDLFVAPSKRWYGAGRILATVLTGDGTYTGIQSIANETGSDGTVRIGTANLNASVATVTFPVGNGAPDVQVRNAAGATAFGIIKDDNHSDIIFNGSTRNEAVRGASILDALRVTDADFPGNADAAFPWQARLDARIGDALAMAPLRQNTVVHLTDSFGDDITDYFYEFWRSERADKRFEEHFYKQVLDDVHVYDANRSWRALYLDLGAFETLRQHPQLGFERLLVSVFASPAKTGRARVGYSTATGRDIGSWEIPAREFARTFSPHRTLFVDMRIPRVVDDSVFRFRT